MAATACQPCDALILTYPDQCRDAYVLTPTAFTIVTASYIIGLVFTTTTIALLWMWRADRVMFSASPRILAVMLVGLALLQTAAYMFGVLQTPRTCAAKYWFLAMGFNLVFGSMFAKVCLLSALEFQHLFLNWYSTLSVLFMRFFLNRLIDYISMNIIL